MHCIGDDCSQALCSQGHELSRPLARDRPNQAHTPAALLVKRQGKQCKHTVIAEPLTGRVQMRMLTQKIRHNRVLVIVVLCAIKPHRRTDPRPRTVGTITDCP